MDRLFYPALLIVVKGTYPLLTIDIGLKIGKQTVWISSIEQVIQDRLEKIMVARAEISIADHIQHAAQFLILIVTSPGAITPFFQSAYLFSLQSENKNILVSDLLEDFDICTI